jgi:hypothetical protein
VQLPAKSIIEYFDFRVHQQDRTVRIGEDLLHQPVAALALRIDQAVEKAIAFRVLDPAIQIAFLFVAKSLAVGYEELKVARVGLINVRMVNLVDDAVAQREPKPATGVVSRADALLGTRSPARLDARCSEGN